MTKSLLRLLFWWLVLSASAAHASTLIDTTINPDIANSRTTNAWPEGQTFKAPSADTFFRSLTYYVQGAGNAPGFLTVSLYRWDNATFNTLGVSLWSSTPVEFFPKPTSDFTGQITALSFTPGINLVGGSLYALIFTITGSGNFLSANDSYPGGQAIVNVNATGWSSFGGIDAPLQMNFEATPLPTTLPLLAAGLGALSLLSWRRKSRRNQSAG